MEGIVKAATYGEKSEGCYVRKEERSSVGKRVLEFLVSSWKEGADVYSSPLVRGC